MASLTKTIQTNPISLQSVASGAVVISTTVDVSTMLSAAFYIRFGRRAATALTIGCAIRIEGSGKSSGDGHWNPLASFVSNIIACEAEAVSGTVNASQKVVTVASTTNLTAGDIIFMDNGTIANSEWGRVKAISANTSVTIEDDLQFAQTGATLYDQAQILFANIDLSGVKRLRVVIDNSGTGQAIAIEVEMISCDSIG